MGTCCSNEAPPSGPTDAKPVECAPDFHYYKGSSALEYWDPIALLGEGSISSIYLVKRRPKRIDVPYRERPEIHVSGHKETLITISLTEEVYALKCIMKNHVQSVDCLDEMRTEINTLSHLRHPNIVQLLEAYERKRHIYLIMDYCPGGDLRQVAKDCSEGYAGAIVKHVLEAVEYMHSCKVVHRDLKLENIMFQSPDRRPSHVKIIDFGLATKYLSDDYKHMTSQVGTIYTMAPQVLQGVYDYKCDLWSMGVVAYILLSGGTRPFWGPSSVTTWSKQRRIMMDRIMRCDYTPMESGRWDHVSDNAKKFVQELLQIDPSQRPSASEALKLPWMQQHFSPQTTIASVSSSDRQTEQFEKLALLLVTQHVSLEEIVQLQQAFVKYDPEETGLIRLDDFRNALIETNQWKKEEVESALDLSDCGSACNTGCCNYVDFITLSLESRRRFERERAAEALETLNAKNENERIDKKTLQQALDPTLTDKFTRELLDRIEWDDDGKVSYGKILEALHHSDRSRFTSARNRLLTSQVHSEDEFDEEAFVTPNNANIPGGKPNESPIYDYHAASKSVRKRGS